MLGFDNRPSASCRSCGRDQHPEAIVSVGVPYFGQALDLCPDCRLDFEHAGRALSEFRPPLPDPRPFPWPGPVPADLESVGDATQAAVGAQLSVRGRHPEFARESELDPDSISALVAAWETWDNALPYYDLATPEHALGTVMFVLLSLELGGRAPKLYGRKGGPAEWLKALADQAKSQPALRDPRLPWLQAVLALEAGNLSTVDRELARGLEWLAEKPAEEMLLWQPVAAGLHYARALRARGRSLHAQERDALKAYCRAAPDDERGFLELAQAHFACARPDVAREILAARVGSADATPTAVAAEVRRELESLRPRLSQLHERTPQDPSPALSYAACLLSLGDAQAAWRVLDGSEWLDQIDPEEGLNPNDDRHEAEFATAARPYLELSARAAWALGERERALTLLRAAHQLALGHEGEVATRRDLLALLSEEVSERLTDLERETRAAHEACRALEKELRGTSGSETHERSGELLRLRGELEALILGAPPEEGGFGHEGLLALHALLGRHRAALDLEFREPVARRALDWFLGREFGARFVPLVEPPSPLDKGDLRLADDRYRAQLAVRALARRQLPDALRHDRQARDVVGFGAPIRLLLTYLELIRRGGESMRVWATTQWIETLPRGGAAEGQLPFEVGLLPVPEEHLESGDLGRFELLCDPTASDRPPAWPPLAKLAGRCQLLFPSEGAPEGLAKVPRVRAYVQRLLAAQPALPLLLDFSSGSGMFRLLVGCLASPDALTLEEPGLNTADASVEATLGSLVLALREAARGLDLDPEPTVTALLADLPDDVRARLLDGAD